MSVLMGAPNVVRGGSHSGNIAARDLAEAGLLDILSSDYVPLEPAAGRLRARRARSRRIALPQAIAHGDAQPRPHRRPGRSRRGSRPAGAPISCASSTTGRRAGRPLRLARGQARRMMPRRPDRGRMHRRRRRPERRRQGTPSCAVRPRGAGGRSARPSSSAASSPPASTTVGEDHQPADEAAFEAMRDGGAFALHWQAPATAMASPSRPTRWWRGPRRDRQPLAHGPRRTSRRYRRPLVVEITAAPEILARRIAARRTRERGGNRESALPARSRSRPFPARSSSTMAAASKTAGRAFADLDAPPTGLDLVVRRHERPRPHSNWPRAIARPSMVRRPRARAARQGYSSPPAR